MSNHRIEVCIGRSCRIFGADRLLTAIRRIIRLSRSNEHGTVEIVTCPCTGYCNQSPNIYIDDVHMPNADEEKIETHLHDLKDKDKHKLNLTDDNEKDRMCCPDEKRTGSIPDADDVIEANNFLGDL